MWLVHNSLSMINRLSTTEVCLRVNGGCAVLCGVVRGSGGAGTGQEPYTSSPLSRRCHRLRLSLGRHADFITNTDVETADYKIMA